MAADCDPFDFELWLSEKLRKLKTDECVFGSYIGGILDGEESLDDKKDAIESIISQFVDSDIDRHVCEILDKWQQSRASVSQPAAASCPHSGDPARQHPARQQVDNKLTRLAELVSAAAPPSLQRHYTEDERKVRDAILSQYSEQEEREDEPLPCGNEVLERNTNCATVAAAARERREQARQQAQRKRDKDKEDREKQKQLKEDKKEKRKTQKGERKR